MNRAKVFSKEPCRTTNLSPVDSRPTARSNFLIGRNARLVDLKSASKLE